MSKQSSSAIAIIIATAAAETILKDGIDAVPVHPLARPHVVASIDWLDRQISPFLTRKTAQTVLGCSQSKLIRIESEGGVESLLDGAIRKISATSIARRMIANALLSHPIDGPALKARKPAKRYQKPPRPRTEAELRGLAIGRAKSHADAEKRKAARAAAGA